MAWAWIRMLVSAVASMAMLATALGCEQTSVNTVRAASPHASPQREHLLRVTTNADLDARARVTGVFVDDRESLLKVQANVQSRVDSPSWIQYHYDWFDSRGMLVEGAADGSGRVQLLGGERTNLPGLAPDPRVVDWRLTIRGL